MRLSRGSPTAVQKSVGDVGMVEGSDQLCLSLESSPRFVIVCERCRDHLDGHVASERQIARAMDLAHAAFADLVGIFIRRVARTAVKRHGWGSGLWHHTKRRPSTRVPPYQAEQPAGGDPLKAPGYAARVVGCFGTTQLVSRFRLVPNYTCPASALVASSTCLLSSL